MRSSLLAVLLLFCSLSAFAQADRRDVRAGNRKFRRDQFKEAEIDYRKALVKDSMSVTARYDLASALYRQEDYEGAFKTLNGVQHPFVPAQYFYNAGNAAAQQKDWQNAVDLYRAALLANPGDLEAKENYIYAKKMLENEGGGDQNRQNQQNQQNQQDQQNQQNQQNQNQNQDQQDQDQDQNQDQDRQDQGDGQKQQEISPQQVQQMLKAIQAQEKATQDKVNKEKAALLKSRQKEKNW